LEVIRIGNFSRNFFTVVGPTPGMVYLRRLFHGRNFALASCLGGGWSPRFRLDACENRCLRRIMRFMYLKKTVSQTKRSHRGHNRDQFQQDDTDAIKMAWAYVTDEGRQTDLKCTWVEAKREKIKRTIEQKMDGLHWRRSTARQYYNKVWKTLGRQLTTLIDIAADRQQFINEISWMVSTWTDLWRKCFWPKGSGPDFTKNMAQFQMFVAQHFKH